MRLIIALLITALIAHHAHADESNEDRLRDALRQAVTQMRAAQDQAAQATADAQKAQSAQAAVQVQLDAANAKLAAQPAVPPADLQQLKDALAAAQAQTTALQAGLAKWQSAYNTAAELARSKDVESQRAGAGLKADMKALDTCKAENAKLIDTAETILHLYQTQGFRSILLRSYEPFIGSAKVTLENTVQAYDDAIHDQEYVPPAGHELARTP